MPDDSITPLDVSAFVVRLYRDAEFRHERFGVSVAELSYAKSDIAALGYARTMLETMRERRRGRPTLALDEGLAAIAEIRASAKSEGDSISIRVSGQSVARLRECLPYFIEYEVLWEKDRSDTGRRRR